MRLNRTNGRWLGVCAGMADWLDVPASLVRVVFVICAISWPTLILGYFLLYFFMDKEITPEKMRSYFHSAKTAEHFRQLDYRKPIYKNASNKRIAGVCSGIADYLEVSAFTVRCITLLSLFIFGPFTFWAYIICIFVFDPDPNPPERSARHAARMQRRQRRQERRASRKQRKRRRNGYANAGYETSVDDIEASMEKEESLDATDSDENSDSNYSRDECTEIFSSLETRLREIEAYITSKKFRLHCEINRI